MKQFCAFFVFLIFGGLFSANASDIIVLRDGNIIEAKVMEIHPSEIRYKRIDNLNGPMIIIPKDSVLSIKYENGVLDIMNPSPAAGTDGVGSYGGPQLGTPTPLQTILNALPAIRIAGINLKFQFGGDKWIAMVNGENFSTGTIKIEDTDRGFLLTLKQTHIWPGAIGKTAGRVASMIPGGAVVGSALNTAGTIAGAVGGAVEAPGRGIVLEYKAGPPAKLSFVRSIKEEGTPSYTPENKMDLDGFNVFAISLTGTPMIPGVIGDYGVLYGGGGITLTIFEKYKPNAFFIPSYFLSGKFDIIGIAYGDIFAFFTAISPGVFFKHRFPGNRVLWNLGVSLDFMLVESYDSVSYTFQKYQDNSYYTQEDYAHYEDFSFLFGMGIQTGFSFRLHRNIVVPTLNLHI